MKLKRAVGIFPDRPTTASALQALRDSGFSMSQVSVIARDADREGAIAGVKVHDQMGNRSREVAAAGAFTGGVLGSVAGLLVGLGSITIPLLAPVLAPVLVAGELAALGTAVAGAIAGAAAGGLLGALIGLGIPEDRARRYRDRVAQGDYLVMLSGTEREIQRAEGVLQQGGVQDWGVYGHSRATATAVRSAPVVAPVVASVEAPRLNRATPSRPEQAIAPPTPTPSMQAPSTQRQGLRPAPISSKQVTPLGGEKRAVGVFRDRPTLESALDALRASGFPMYKLSFVMRDLEHLGQLRNEARGITHHNPRLQATPTPSGNALGNVTGLLVGLNRVTVPGMGPVLVGGAEAPVLAAALDGGMLSAIGGGFKSALMHLGVPQEPAKTYQDQVSQGASLVFVKASGEEVLHAALVLNQQGMYEWGIYEVAEAMLDASARARHN